MNTPFNIRRRFWFALPFVLLALAGCAKRPGVEDNASQKPPIRTVEKDGQADKNRDSFVTPTPMPTGDLKILSRYRTAQAYQDQAILTLRYQLENGQQESEQTKIGTRYTAPNRLHVSVSSKEEQVEIVAHGTQVSAKIVDPVTKNFNNQVVIREIGEELSFSDLYQATELVDPVAPDEMLSALLAVPAGLDMLPLSLVWGEGKLAELVSRQSTHASLGTQLLTRKDGAERRCEVIDAKSAEGTYRLWIADEMLLRVDCPPMHQNLLPGVKRMDLRIDFSNVIFDGSSQGTPVTLKGTKVRHFVMPPIPPTTSKLGQPVGPLIFQNQNHEAVPVINQDGQISVLVWFRNRPESRMTLEAIERVRRRNRSDRVRFAAISGERQATPEVLTQWDVKLAWLEDHQAQGRDIFQIEHGPTVVVLGANNSIQYFEVGANPNIGHDIAAVVERLVAGQDVAATSQKRFQETQLSYARLLARAQIDGDGWVEELEAKLPAFQLPTRLKLTEAWTNTKIEEPGNFLVVPGKRRQILVVDGWTTLAMLDLDGGLVRRLSLDLPPDEGISILRAGSNGRDRALFAAASRGGRRAFVFDFAGKQQMPPVELPQFAISDILIHDIDNNRSPELIVGWQGRGGVDGISLDGKKNWSNQAAPGVISLTPVKDDSSGSERRPVLVAGESGLMFLIDENGRTLREIRLEQVVHQLTAWPGPARGFDTILKNGDEIRGDNHAASLGISTSAMGGRVVTGLNREWKFAWSYGLPGGVYRHQVDLPQSFSLPRLGPAWLLPGPDGSIHFLSVDGKFRDTMFTGQHIRGVAGIEVDEEAYLLVSTDQKVSAWKVTPPDLDRDSAPTQSEDK